MLERSITGKVGQALRDDKRFWSCAVEVKMVHGKTLRKGELKEHQYRALGIAHESGLYYKIEDGGYGQKPFDIFVLKFVESFLVIWFQIEARKHEVWAIPFKWIPEEGKEKITIEEARRKGLLLDL